MNTTTFVLLRLAVGASMLGHGLVRLPKLRLFSAWMMGTFEKSMLPAAMIKPFSMALPVIEFMIGLLLLAGLWTYPALFSGGIVMLLLILGTTLIENWEAIPAQLIHIAFFAVLLQYISSNKFSLDQLIRPGL
jgi:thiosulfate dehydrogenase [quinone] large subunit